MNKIKNRSKLSVIIICLIGVFFIIYSEIHQREYKSPFICLKSDALYYHEYIAVHMFGMPSYIPRSEIKVSTYTMGMSITYMPAIFLGYILTELNDDDHDFGRNSYYQHMLFYLGLLYTIGGFVFLRKILLRWCNEWVVSITLMLLFFGTNLYYYVNNEPAMSHAVNFALISIFIFYSLKFIENPKFSSALKSGIFLGLILLIRPNNFLVSVFPVVVLISRQGIKGAMIFIKDNFKWILLIGALSIMFFLPQMFYWRHFTGEWLYYSYRNERFYFNNPAILQFLVSYRKGWWVYTPLMLLILPGALIVYRRDKPIFWAILIFTFLNVYVLSSWWCWWYGGSFGMRSMIDSYGMLAILIAIFIQFIYDKSKILLSVFILVSGFVVYLNLFQTRQAKIGELHWDSMNSKVYWKIFLKDGVKDNYTEEDWDLYLSHPNLEKARAGERFW